MFRYLLLALLIITQVAHAQRKIDHQQMVWLRYNGRYYLSANWNLGLETEERRFVFPDRQQYWVLPRIGLSRKITDNLSAEIGFTYYLNNIPADPEKATVFTAPELRPHEEIDLQQQVHKLSINHRYRLEERYQRNYNDSVLLRAYHFNFRMRYQLMMIYPLIKSSKLNIKAADEVMLNFGSRSAINVFDQNRIYLALNYALSKKLQLELGYMNWFQEKNLNDQFVERDILRLSLYQKIGSYY